METIYDWITMAIFGGLVVLFLQRSVADEPAKDHILQYMPPAIGCAVANCVGNHPDDIPYAGPFSALIVVVVLVYILLVLKPFNLGR